MQKFPLIISILLSFTMTGHAQITSQGFDTIKLNSNIYEYMGITAFPKFQDHDLFCVEKPENIYSIAVPTRHDSPLCIKYLFAQTDSEGQIKRITIFIDDSNNSALVLLKQIFGNEYTTGQSSIGKAHGNIFYGWVTTDKTFILMAKTEAINKNFGIPMTSIAITKQSDLQKIADNNILIKLPELLF